MKGKAMTDFTASLRTEERDWCGGVKQSFWLGDFSNEIASLAEKATLAMTDLVFKVNEGSTLNAEILRCTQDDSTKKHREHRALSA